VIFMQWKQRRKPPLKETGFVFAIVVVSVLIVSFLALNTLAQEKIESKISAEIL